MGAFTFQPEYKVRIEGDDYALQAFSLNHLKQLEEKQQEILLALDTISYGESLAEEVSHMCALIGTMVDLLLGEGSYHKIFENKKDNLLDHSELLGFLLDEVHGLRQQEVKRFQSL